MRTHIESLHSTGLGGFGHSAADDADTAGREAGSLRAGGPGAGCGRPRHPHGRRGEAIALEARIIYAADAFVAMTLDRPYRLAMAREDALAELVRHRGTQFDASVVDALLALERPGALPAAA
jgi:hypothetical protein